MGYFDTDSDTLRLSLHLVVMDRDRHVRQFWHRSRHPWINCFSASEEMIGSQPVNSVLIAPCRYLLLFLNSAFETGFSLTRCVWAPSEVCQAAVR